MYYQFTKCVTVYYSHIVKARSLKEAAEKASEEIWEKGWQHKELDLESLQYRYDKDIDSIGECNYQDLKGENFDILCNL